ncbi:hypothetical protein Nepgr_031284 [Nepenthes gracilis]|uniref:Uncharacterized protein n=1 Tax=Nepenthes gracilis TaxID=150966 RepID=A0AAD3THT9_NEPGR|nr:hypothetical protein Nepgr_031284 [Nepenthes gracilis]
MAVRIKGSYLVKPAEPTWNGILPLSEWDQIGPLAHVSTIYLYKPPDNRHTSDHALITILNDSLQHALVPFYPMAGRINRIAGGRLKLHCNGMGAELIEAEYSGPLDDFGNFSSSTPRSPVTFEDLIPRVNYGKPVHELPLMLAQLTTFRSGGISLGVRISPAAFDWQSSLHFLSERARLARGEPLEVLPYIDRKILRAREPPSGPPRFKHMEFNQPPLLIDQQNKLDEQKKETTVAFLPLTKGQVERLKRVAGEGLLQEPGDGGRHYRIFGGLLSGKASRLLRYSRKSLD